jgi:hypothetical protein
MAPPQPESACPFIEAVGTPTCFSDMYLCGSPAWQGRNYAPSVGRLAGHCLIGCGYASCPHYQTAQEQLTASSRGLRRREPSLV